MGKLYYHSAEFNFNRNIVKELDVVVFNDSAGNSRSNITGTIITDVNRGIGSFSILGKTSPESRDFDKVWMKGTVDVCNIAKGMRGNFIVANILDNLKEFSNFEFRCPTKKGFYYATNFPIADDSYIPYFLMSGKGQVWQTVFTLRGKPVLSKSAPIFIGSLKLFGSFAH